LSTQITAIATAVLALFAIAATVVARMAFRKQSQEVKILEVQQKEQNEFNKRQVAVLQLQAQELSASLEERRTNREEQHRAQATRIFIWEDRQFVGNVIAHVKNSSAQPIYEIAITWQEGSKFRGEDQFDQPYLLPGEERISPSAINAQNVNNLANLNAFLMFRDAAGTYWRTYPDGILKEVRPEGII
jgi:hypothetical protein